MQFGTPRRVESEQTLMQCGCAWMAGMAMALASVAPLFAAEPTDEICLRLKAFETAPFVKSGDGKPRLRSVEYRWIGYYGAEVGWAKSCGPSENDNAAREFCDWLLDGNISFEFSGALAVRTLACYGFNLPNRSEVDPWFATVDFEGEQKDRHFVLQIDFRARTAGRRDALRLLVVPYVPFTRVPPNDMIDESKWPLR